MGNNFSSEYQEFDHSNPVFARLEPLKFHELHSSGVVVSPNHLVLRCLDQGSGMAFSDRPIQPEEIICLKVVMFHKGVFRFGLTTYDPASLSQESLGTFLARSSKSIFLKEVSSGTTQKNTLIFFKFNQDGRVVYGWQRKDKEKDKGVLISDVPVHIPVWAIFHISGRNLALKLEGDSLQVLRAKSFRRKQAIVRTKSLEVLSLADNTRDISPSSNVDPEVQSSHQEEGSTNFSRSRSFSITGPSQRRASQSSTAPDPQTTQILIKAGRQQGRRFSKLQPKQIEERIPMCFHLKSGRNISLSTERMMATNRTGQSNGYVFTRRPLWTEEKLVIHISKVNVESGANLGFGLTVCDPKVVTEFPDDADELLDREEYWVFVKDACTNLVEGDVLAFMISKKGEVGISKNQSPFRILMHVDPLMLFWAFFDVTGPLEKISSLGTVLHRKQSTECLTDSSVEIPRSDVLRPLPSQPTPGARSNEKYEQLSHATTVQENLVTSRKSQVITPQVRNNSHYLDLFADLPSQLAPPLIPVPSNVRPQIPQRKSKAPREIRRPNVAAPPPAPESQNTEIAKKLSPKEIESLLKVDVTESSKEEQKPTEALLHECSICFENEPNCVLYTCGHMCLCYECGQGILKGSNPLCPLCRKPVADVIKIYKS